MEIILLEDIVTLGFKDEIVTVKDGYGRNYLIPQGKAIIASDSAKKVLAENLKQRAHKIAQIKKEAEDLGAKLGGVTLTIMAKTSNRGVIYGSISNIQIAEALQAKGFEVDRKKILVKESIKEIGDYVAHIRLHRDVTVEIPFTVESENAAEEIAAAKAKEEAEREAIKAADKARKEAEAKAKEEGELSEEEQQEETPEATTSAE
ncbi:50S ribosomal protein L9 [Porphyromonas crevioricanis]|uniref:Large ribosomal subunit protein bL9 n=2 Tax=Porphyromonas crevioricanis TaxID=393921 RepID=A0A2X4PZ65_9PORP|nr:50S ribosomal protein L9 [Porphyromonas crevioricanis]GAD05474.1 LSU ribosomal protein L9p [Porphyromonas crevioricanis JCM 15906]GAD07700.1 LSU ribosomal protein L9p [Porphyromonas crevioricanis JCM 13913]SJZ94520.1 large subunit ribosomal protein L9 [Porphyromonas crevioricanis]SQH73619.1 50S ribosomal protein L9 [Porphyromonas crevioricanis]